MSKLNLDVQDIVVLSDEMVGAVAGGGGTMGCSKPCQTTCDSSNCKTTTGSGGDSGCRPTSKDCKCNVEFN